MTTIDTSTPIDPANLDRTALMQCVQPSPTPYGVYRLQLQQRYGDLAASAQRRIEQQREYDRRRRKFSPEQIREIRRLARTVIRSQIAIAYDTSTSMITAIVNGVVYRDVADEPERQAA